MAPKDQADQTERRSPLLLPNRISDAKPALTVKIRRAIQDEIPNLRPQDAVPHFIVQMTMCTSILPAHWEKFPSDLKMFLEKEMFDPVIKHVLETEKIINWCPSVQKLYPLITPGDGNCLLHAVSLGMWGVDDSELVLRKALYDVLRNDNNKRNHLRWQRERIRVDSGIPGSGLRYNTTEWESEWEMVKKIASPEERPPAAQGLRYESLEQYHVFMLANMLRRPIIVLAQDMMRSQWGHSLQPQRLQGIYLPLNWSPQNCYRYPILLGFYSNHFVPLLSTAKLDSEEEALNHLVPIMQENLTRMAVHFLEEEEEARVEDLLQKYLVIEDVAFIGESLLTTRSILGARLVCSNSFPNLDLMDPYLQLAETHYRAYLETEYGGRSLGTSLGAPSASLTKVEEKVPREKSNSFPSVSGSSLVTTGKHSWSGSGAPVSQATETPASNPTLSRMFSLVNQSCKTAGCIYYRSVSTGEYCHECFKKRNQTRKCEGDRCMNPPEQGCKGLCRVCFDQRKLMEGPSTTSSSPFSAPVNPDPTNHQASRTSPEDPLLKTTPLEKQSQQPQGVSSSSPSSSWVQLGEEPFVELNSILVHQRLPSKKCIIPECPLTGDPAKNDMCSRCYAENLQVAQELSKASKGKDDLPAPTNEDEESLVGRTAYGNGGIEGATAAAGNEQEPRDPNQSKQKPNVKYTVQKNICAMAGCDGVRLADESYQGFCINCYRRNRGETSQPVPVQDLTSPKRNRVPPESLIASNLARPTHKPVPRKDITSNLDVKYNPQGTAGKVKETDVLNRPSSPASAAAAAAATVSKDKICMHPRCSNLAVPPKYMLCEECIHISEMFHEKDKIGAAVKTVGSKVQESEPTAARPKEATAKSDVQSAPSKAELSKLETGFKNVLIKRIKCQVAGGCADDMYGDPEKDNLCSRCFAKMTFRRTRNRSSPPPHRLESRPLSQPLLDHYNTAPIKPSPRVASVKPSSQTEVIYINHEAPQFGGRGQRQKALPDNYRACATHGCLNQANLQILEGYCNDCHQVYRNQHLTPPEDVVAITNPQATNRGRYAKSSQSTVPEAWNSPPAHREEKILNIEDVKKAPPVAQANRTDMKCFSDNCTNYGNPRCQGYCNSCFRLMV